jgi:putative addiction module component (TIGR02574 family)
MSVATDELLSQIKELPDDEKLQLVDAILTDLNRPTSQVERSWTEEAQRRWASYKAGKISTVSYEEVMNKHR